MPLSKEISELINTNMRVLVVDDSSTMRSIISNNLKDMGMTNVVKADDGDTAWETLQKDSIDLILSDHNMPRVSGEELLKMVRDSEEYRDTPFIMITAESFKDNVVNAVKLGVSNYIVKPFSSEQLMKKILSVCAKR